MVDPPTNFCLSDYISFFSSSTRASSQNRIKRTDSSIPRLNATKHFFFNRVTRIWNALPPIDMHRSFFSIRRNILSIFWKYFLDSYSIDRPCSWHFVPVLAVVVYHHLVLVLIISTSVVYYRPICMSVWSFNTI